MESKVVRIEEVQKFLESQYSWVERIGLGALISVLAAFTAAGLLIYVIKKLVHSYTAQIEDLRKQRDKFQDLKVSSGAKMANLQSNTKIES